MRHGVNVQYINPFLQSSISVLNSVVQMQMMLGKPAIGMLDFEDDTFLLQIGVTGELKGQVILAMSIETAKEIASRMMCGMPVEELNEMPRSALSELSNMIMGNAATLFSNSGVSVDITTPMSMLGSNLSLQTDIETLKVPLLYEEKEAIGIYVCVTNE